MHRAEIDALLSANTITPNSTPRLMQSIKHSTASVHSLFVVAMSITQIEEATEVHKEKEIEQIKRELHELDQDLADREVAARDEEISILKNALDSPVSHRSSSHVDLSLELEHNKMQWGLAREQVATQQSAVEAVEHLLQVCSLAGQKAQRTAAKGVAEATRAMSELAELQLNNINSGSHYRKCAALGLKATMGSIATHPPKRMLAAWRVNTVSALKAVHAAEIATSVQSHRKQQTSFREDNAELLKRLALFEQVEIERDYAEEQLGTLEEKLKAHDHVVGEAKQLQKENYDLRAEAMFWHNSKAHAMSGELERDLEDTKRSLSKLTSEHEGISETYEQQQREKADLVAKLKEEFNNATKMGNEIIRLREVIEESGELKAAEANAKTLRMETQTLRMEAELQTGQIMDLEQRSSALLDLQDAHAAMAMLHDERDSLKQTSGVRLLRDVCYGWVQQSVGTAISHWCLKSRHAAQWQSGLRILRGACHRWTQRSISSALSNWGRNARAVSLQLAKLSAEGKSEAVREILKEQIDKDEQILKLNEDVIKERDENGSRLDALKEINQDLNKSVSQAKADAEHAASLNTMKRVMARLTLGAAAERIRNFRLNWLDGLTTMRVRALKRQAEASYQSSSMMMFRRAYKRIQYGPVGNAFVNWQLNRNASWGSGAMSKTLAGVVREGALMMLKRTMLQWTKNATRMMLHTWRSSMNEVRHGEQVMYLAEENDGLAYQLEEKKVRLSELERFSAFFDETTGLDLASPKSS